MKSLLGPVVAFSKSSLAALNRCHSVILIFVLFLFRFLRSRNPVPKLRSPGNPRSKLLHDILNYMSNTFNDKNVGKYEKIIQ